MRLPRFRALLGLLPAFLLALSPVAQARAQAPLGGGSPLNTTAGSRCTAGFAATAHDTGYLILSDSCARAGSTVHSGGKVVGIVEQTPFPPDGTLVLRVTNTDDWRLTGSIPPTDSRVTIAGSTEAPIGASVCRYGVTTGWKCGTVQAKNVTIDFPEGPLTGLTRTSVCAEPGDIGAPFVSGTQAQGVLVAATGTCSGGHGSSYFLPINPILAATGLTLVTGALR
ncbi:S1 family peptidase [Amycolatopsis samaneae]|uniref:S1 family peptidase n=1 Tax=Amycolatopsis samaneae TaxID=664691 RepID=A0ABW5G6Y1_9PSEU